MATFKIESLQQAMSESVPSSSLEDANRQYAELTARYRHLLEKEQSHSANERRMEEMELVVNNLRQEKSTLNEELKVLSIIGLTTLIKSIIVWIRLPGKNFILAKSWLAAFMEQLQLQLLWWEMSHRPLLLQWYMIIKWKAWPSRYFRIS